MPIHYLFILCCDDTFVRLVTNFHFKPHPLKHAFLGPNFVVCVENCSGHTRSGGTLKLSQQNSSVLL